MSFHMLVKDLRIAQKKTLRQFCQAGVWLHKGKAHWFDEIDDALHAYKDSLPK